MSISRDILRGPRLFWFLNLRGQKSLGPLKMSLKMAHKVIVPQKKIMSRSFLNSGTLIVTLAPHNQYRLCINMTVWGFGLNCCRARQDLSTCYIGKSSVFSRKRLDLSICYIGKSSDCVPGTDKTSQLVLQENHSFYILSLVYFPRSYSSNK
jgi:hypothetical protein